MFTIRILAIIITIETYCKRHVQVKIMKKFHEIDRNFAENLNLEINYHRLRRQIALQLLQFHFSSQFSLTSQLQLYLYQHIGMNQSTHNCLHFLFFIHC